jgi:hypothetical protein
MAVLLLVGATGGGPTEQPRRNLALGVTFSARYASWLGFDARAAYVTMLDDLGVRRVRLPVYWDEVERSPGRYDFTELDVQLAEAEARNVSVLLVVGYRQPRFPECYPPAWTRDLPLDAFRAHILRLVDATLMHVRRSPSISMWQVENEPFVKFGDCDFDVLTPTFVSEEIDLIRRLDDRPILITDSGEASNWIASLGTPASHFGISLYRDVHMPVLGIVHYPMPAWTYTARDWLARSITRRDGVTIISELQAEGWFESTEALDQVRAWQKQRFPADMLLDDNLEYARDTQFDQAYLWGVEWWYWMAAHGHSEYLDAARRAFATTE